MKLHNLKPASGSTKGRKRIARGTGSGRGGTSTKGHKGAKARTGFKSKRGHEGGQMPLQMRLPKRGFKNTHRRYKSYRAAEYVVFNLSALDAIATENNLSVIDAEVLMQMGLLGKNESFKVLGDGELSKGLEVSANRFSASAKSAIVAAGGNAYHILKSNQIQGVAEKAHVANVNMKTLCEYFSFLEETDKVHVVAEGSLKTKFNLDAHKAADEVKEMLQALGGKVNIIG